MSRMDELLVSTARELKQGRAPLNEVWLVQNEVTFDEATGLAETLATAVHVYRAAIRLGLELSAPRGGERDLATIVQEISVLQGGPFAVLAAGMRLEELADAAAEEPQHSGPAP